MKVLIAGAGLGGLCLTHGLRRAGLEVQVMERRPSPADQPASYGIHRALLNRREVPVVPAPVLATAATHASA
jgi:2-polyprenyl-6-methoxyphenol hydroxylase-like FAD-dependent oxidoreductase